MCHAWYIMKMSWKFIDPFSMILLTNMGLGNRNTIPYSRVNRKTPKIFQIISCLMTWKFLCQHVHPVSVMLLTDTGFLEKYKKKPRVQIFQIVPCILPNISWKCDDNPSMPFPVMLLTANKLCKIALLWCRIIDIVRNNLSTCANFSWGKYIWCVDCYALAQGNAYNPTWAEQLSCTMRELNLQCSDWGNIAGWQLWPLLLRMKNQWAFS